MTLGERLRELRIADPYLTLREAAALVGADPRWLSDVEVNRLKPTPDALADLAKTYGADVATLVPLWNQWRPAPPADLSGSICDGRRV